MNSIAAGTWGGTAYSGTGNVTLTVSTVTGSKAFSAPVVQTGTTTMTMHAHQHVVGRRHDHQRHRQHRDDGCGIHVRGRADDRRNLRLDPDVVDADVLRRGRRRDSANGSCTITVGPISVGTTATAGNHTNTIAVNGVVTNQGNNTGTITGVAAVTRALTVAKAFNPTSVQAAPSRGLR